MRMSAGHAFSGRMVGNTHDTSTSSTTLAGILTFSEAAGTALRSRAQQQRVRCRALDRREPLYHHTKHPHTRPRVACAPNATTDARCSFAAHAGRLRTDGGGWRSSTAQRHLQSSWGRGPSRGPWWRGGRTLFFVDRTLSLTSASRSSALSRVEGRSGTRHVCRPAQ